MKRLLYSKCAFLVVCESAKTKEKAAEEGGTRRGRIQLKPSGSSGLCLGITRHPCDKPHAVFVRQPSADESCKTMGRWRLKSDVSRSARRRHFTGSNWRAPKKNNSRSSDVSGQGESASNRTCKWRSRHPRLFQAKMFPRNGTTDKLSSLHLARASPERKYGEIWRSKVDVEQRGAEGD